MSELIHRYLLDNAMFRKLPREQKLIICFEGTGNTCLTMFFNKDFRSRELCVTGNSIVHCILTIFEDHFTQNQLGNIVYSSILNIKHTQ